MRKTMLTASFILWGAAMFLSGWIAGGWAEWDRGYAYAEKVYYYGKNGLKHPAHYRTPEKLQIAGAGDEGERVVYDGK